MNPLSQPIHATLEDAFASHWEGQTVNAPPHAIVAMMERHLEETLRDSIARCPELQPFYPFPLRIRVLQGKKPGEFGWGFMPTDDELLDWLYQVRPEAMTRHFPSSRWVKTGLPRVSRNEIAAALAMLIREEKLRKRHGEDTIGVLMKNGIFRVLQNPDAGVVALARIIDAYDDHPEPCPTCDGQSSTCPVCHPIPTRKRTPLPEGCEDCAGCPDCLEEVPYDQRTRGRHWMSNRGIPCGAEEELGSWTTNIGTKGAIVVECTTCLLALQTWKERKGL